MEVEILKFDHLGNGLGKIDDKVIFVKKALPNEIVKVKIENEKKKYQVGKIEEIKKVNHNRIKSICPYYEECGGCDFLHIKNEYEIKFKKEKGKELISDNLNFFDTKEYHYRNKATFHIQDKKVGFYKGKSKCIIDIDYCYLIDLRINQVLKKLRQYLKENNDNITSACIRVGREIMLIIEGEISSFFVPYFNFVDTIIVNNKVVKGKGYIEKEILDYNFKISPNSFFQVNDDGLKAIANILKNNIKTKYRKALDLYSGTSVMGILISSFCDEVISVESCYEAARDALDNIENNHLTNIKVINDQVENVIDKLHDIDLIVIDPPRKGLDHKTIGYLNRLLPSKIIYISCDMITLKRDLEILSANYELESLSLVNMFPKTYHVESVCVLKLR